MTFNNLETFFSLYNNISKKVIPIKTSYKLRKLFNIISEEQKNYAEEMKRIIELYAKKDENGNYEMSKDKKSILINEDKVNECARAITELGNLEVKIEDISFTLDEIEPLDLTFEDFMIIAEFIKE